MSINYDSVVKNMELTFMDLETRTKKLITDIVEPLRNRMTEDSKVALRYSPPKNDSSLLDRTQRSER